jgi:N utilization substance protein A
VFITNALAPAKLKSFEIDEANRVVRIMVSEDQLSLAIGKRGQNARLTTKLTGWHVDIEAEQVVKMGFDEKVAQAVEDLTKIPGITQEQANVLVHQGMTLENLLQAEESDLAEIPEIGAQAPAILAAVQAEAGRKSIKLDASASSQGE